MSQFGYRKNRSTNMAATLLIDDIRDMVDKGQMVGSVFIDLSKAFDTLSHSVLLQKLPSYGVAGPELMLLTNYLFARQQYVQIDGKCSNMTNVSTVPQGSILGPLLFVLYFNDLADHLQKCRILMYADDTVVYYGNDDLSNIEDTLTKELENVAEYFDDNDLIINLSKGKTEAMLFGTNKRLSKQNRNIVKYKNVPVQNTNSYQYLGHTVDPALNLQETFNSSYKKAAKSHETAGKTLQPCG